MRWVGALNGLVVSQFWGILGIRDRPADSVKRTAVAYALRTWIVQRNENQISLFMDIHLPGKKMMISGSAQFNQFAQFQGPHTSSAGHGASAT